MPYLFEICKPGVAQHSLGLNTYLLIERVLTDVLMVQPCGVLTDVLMVQIYGVLTDVLVVQPYGVLTDVLMVQTYGVLTDVLMVQTYGVLTDVLMVQTYGVLTDVLIVQPHGVLKYVLMVHTYDNTWFSHHLSITIAIRATYSESSGPMTHFSWSYVSLLILLEV